MISKFFDQIVQEFSNFKQMRIGAFSVGLATRTPLANETAMNGLSAIQKAFPELLETSYDEKQQVFTITNSEPDSEKQILFRLQRSRRLNCAWGSRTQFGNKEQIVKLFDTFQDEFHLHPINIELLDMAFYALCNFPGNHYQAIWNAYFDKTPLFNLFNGDTLLQCEFALRGMLDQERICVVDVTSDIKDIEIMQRKFENKRLRTTVAIAHTKRIDPEARLSAVLENHLSVSIPYVLEKFIPNFISPLEKILTEMVPKQV